MGGEGERVCNASHTRIDERRVRGFLPRAGGRCSCDGNIANTLAQLLHWDFKVYDLGGNLSWS
jgi:hypothetical protein